MKGGADEGWTLYHLLQRYPFAYSQLLYNLARRLLSSTSKIRGVSCILSSIYIFTVLLLEKNIFYRIDAV